MKREPFPARINHTKIEKAYAFFSRMEATGEPFTSRDIEQATGYTAGVVHVYLSKKLDSPSIFPVLVTTRQIRNSKKHLSESCQSR